MPGSQNLWGGLYDRLLRHAGSTQGLVLLMGVTFLNSSVLPVPQDIFLVPVLLAQPRRAWWVTTLCVAVSTMGGLVGYLIGRLFYDTLGLTLLELYGITGGFQDLSELFGTYGYWAIIFSAVTPFPYKILTIASGFLQYPLAEFMLFSLMGRAARFYFYAVLFHFFGTRMQQFVRRGFLWFFLAGIAVLVALLVLMLRQVLS